MHTYTTSSTIDEQLNDMIETEEVSRNETNTNDDDSMKSDDEETIMKPGDFMEAEGDVNGNTLPPNGVPRWGPQHAGAQQLASMYSGSKRLQETISTYLSAIVGTITAVLIMYNIQYQFLPYMLIAIIAAGLVVDFLSGVVHWAADSWGTVDLPILGKALLRPFREHHIDPTCITRHDFIETSGDLCAVSIPFFCIIAYKQMQFIPWTSQLVGVEGEIELDAQQYGWDFFMFAFAVLTVMTNTFHKWSHTYFGLPAWIEWLQWARLIIPKKQHRLHHISPHDTHFCITTGWCNPPLQYIGFWPKLEWVITAITGAKPRTDDLAWAAKVTE